MNSANTTALTGLESFDNYVSVIHAVGEKQENNNNNNTTQEICEKRTQSCRHNTECVLQLLSNKAHVNNNYFFLS